jgi:hypothetical protein
MRINWNSQDGFNLDVPYSRWLIFCIGASLLLKALPDIINAIHS